MCGKIPTAVSCVIGTLDAPERFTTEDTSLLTIDFDGIKWVIDLTWASSLRNTYYAVNSRGGAIIVENDLMVCVNNETGYSEATIISEFDDPLHRSWFKDMITDFLHAITHPDRRNPLLLEALTISLVIEAAYTSAANRGVWTDVPLPSIEYLL